MKTIYILTFDRNSTYDYNILHNGIKTDSQIINWWHFLKSSYLLVSTNSSATLLSERIRTYFPNQRFLLTEINLKNHNGWLPKEAWDWINSNK